MSNRLLVPLTATLLALALLVPPLVRAQNASQQLAADSVLETIKKRGSIKIGLSTFVPWAMRNKSGELIGYEIDVAKQLAEDMKVKAEFVPTAWDGIIPALLAGKFDVIIGGTGSYTHLDVYKRQPFLGWLGVFLTGSDTSSNALFANLQQVTAQQIGVDPTLTIAANTTGGVTGKMISPQSIAVALSLIHI